MYHLTIVLNQKLYLYDYKKRMWREKPAKLLIPHSQEPSNNGTFSATNTSSFFVPSVTSIPLGTDTINNALSSGQLYDLLNKYVIVEENALVIITGYQPLTSSGIFVQDIIVYDMLAKWLNSFLLIKALFNWSNIISISSKK